MDRRYVGVQAIGKPIDIFDRIRLIIQGQGMTRTIPAVKFEKKPDKLFFVFLAVEGTDKPVSYTHLTLPTICSV